MYGGNAFSRANAAALPFFDESYVTPNKYHKMPVEKWYLVLYQIQGNMVHVDFILDYRKEYGWIGN